eukprot:7571-Heterococcus_DN1.PRE.2
MQEAAAERATATMMRTCNMPQLKQYSRRALTTRALTFAMVGVSLQAPSIRMPAKPRLRASAVNSSPATAMGLLSASITSTSPGLLFISASTTFLKSITPPPAFTCGFESVQTHGEDIWMCRARATQCLREENLLHVPLVQFEHGQ